MEARRRSSTIRSVDWSRKSDRLGYSVFFQYDSSGRCVHSMAEDGLHEVHLEFRPAERLTCVTRGDGGRWKYLYDADGLVSEIIDPYGGSTTYKFNEDGQVTTETDPSGNVTRFLYSASGALTGKQSPLGHVTPVTDEDEEEIDPFYHRVADCPAEWEFGDLVEWRDREKETTSHEDHLSYTLGEAPEPLTSLNEYRRIEGVSGDARRMRLRSARKPCSGKRA